MFPSSVIIAGGKRRRDINTTDATDPSPRHVHLWPHVRASAAFSKGASGLRAKSPEARSQVSGRFDILHRARNVEFSLFLILFYFRTLSVNSKARGQGFPKRLYSRSGESQSTYDASTKFDITHNNRESLTYLSRRLFSC